MMEYDYPWAAKSSDTGTHKWQMGTPTKNGYDASPDQFAHRRSYSDVYNSTPSLYNGPYAIQPYTPSSLPNRERRTRSWDLSADPELLRKKRLASYKAYGIEGKVKATVKKSLRWVKGKYNKLVYGAK